MMAVIFQNCSTFVGGDLIAWWKCMTWMQCKVSVNVKWLTAVYLTHFRFSTTDSNSMKQQNIEMVWKKIRLSLCCYSYLVVKGLGWMDANLLDGQLSECSVVYSWDVYAQLMCFKANVSVYPNSPYIVHIYSPFFNVHLNEV